jgi:glycosyltransferase involved in cell wall biosynthesis
MKDHSAYVLVTAAYNEEAFIERTIRAIIQQTCLPTKWVIVSDGSWDGTEQIVKTYASRYGFIELLRIEERHVHNFGSKVRALNMGLDCLKDLDYDFIGILDADISFEPSYFGLLLGQFAQDPRLGLAGGFIYEARDGIFRSRLDNSVGSVAGAIQLFRRECYDAVRGFVPLEYGGEDWYAEIMAKMNGWRVEAFPDLKVFHHKPTGAGAPGLRHQYRQGLADFALGTYPLFEVFKCLRRLRTRPYVLGALTRFSGFVWAYCRRQKRSVPVEVIEFLKSEQKARLRHLLP